MLLYSLPFFENKKKICTTYSTLNPFPLTFQLIQSNKKRFSFQNNTSYILVFYLLFWKKGKEVKWGANCKLDCKPISLVWTLFHNFIFFGSSLHTYRGGAQYEIGAAGTLVRILESKLKLCELIVFSTSSCFRKQVLFVLNERCYFKGSIIRMTQFLPLR